MPSRISCLAEPGVVLVRFESIDPVTRGVYSVMIHRLAPELAFDMAKGLRAAAMEATGDSDHHEEPIEDVVQRIENEAGEEVERAYEDSMAGIGVFGEALPIQPQAAAVEAPTPTTEPVEQVPAAEAQTPDVEGPVYTPPSAPDQTPTSAEPIDEQPSLSESPQTSSGDDQVSF